MLLCLHRRPPRANTSNTATSNTSAAPPSPADFATLLDIPELEGSLTASMLPERRRAGKGRGVSPIDPWIHRRGCVVAPDLRRRLARATRSAAALEAMRKKSVAALRAAGAFSRARRRAPDSADSVHCSAPPTLLTRSATSRARRWIAPCRWRRSCSASRRRERRAAAYRLTSCGRRGDARCARAILTPTPQSCAWARRCARSKTWTPTRAAARARERSSMGEGVRKDAEAWRQWMLKAEAAPREPPSASVARARAGASSKWTRRVARMQGRVAMLSAERAAVRTACRPRQAVGAASEPRRRARGDTPSAESALMATIAALAVARRRGSTTR